MAEFVPVFIPIPVKRETLHVWAMIILKENNKLHIGDPFDRHWLQEYYCQSSPVH